MSDETGTCAGPEGGAARLPSQRVSRALRRGRVLGRWKRIGHLVGGVTCLVIGVIGGFLPILQGWIFIGLGIALLAPVFPPARRAMVWAFRRWPRLRRAVPRRFRRRALALEDVEERVDAPVGDEVSVP